MKWLLTATVVCGMGKIISFSSVVRPHKLLAPCPALQPLPPDRRFAAHPPAERCLLKHSPLMPTFFLLKLCLTGSVKTRYWGHNLYTWMSPPDFVVVMGPRGSVMNVLASHLSRHTGGASFWNSFPSWDSIGLYLAQFNCHVACPALPRKWFIHFRFFFNFFFLPLWHTIFLVLNGRFLNFLLEWDQTFENFSLLTEA